MTKTRLELVAALFSPGLIGLARDKNGLVEDKFAPGERERNLKPVPALEADLPLCVAGYRYDWKSGHLSQGDDPVLNDISRPLWPVRRHRQVVSPSRMAS